MSTTTTDRELRDRLEALEAEVKRLTQAQTLMQHVVIGSGAPPKAFERWEMRAFAWLGRNELAAVALFFFVLGLPILTVVQVTPLTAPLLAYFFVWSQLVCWGMAAMFRGAKALNVVYERVRR